MKYSAHSRRTRDHDVPQWYAIHSRCSKHSSWHVLKRFNECYQSNVNIQYFICVVCTFLYILLHYEFNRMLSNH